MRVIHLQDFSLHKAGDIVEIPDGSVVSPLYFAEVDENDQIIQPAAPEADPGPVEPEDEAPVARPEHDFVPDEVPEKVTRKGKG